MAMNLLKRFLGPLIRWSLRHVFALLAWLEFLRSGYSIEKAIAAAPLPKPAFYKRFCIFALYQNGALDANVKAALATLAQKGFSVLVVNSGKLSQKEIPCWHYIERENQGRDFGAYQFGVLFLKKYLGDTAPEKLIFCNDSVFYLPNRFPEFLDSILARSDDWIGVTQAEAPVPHIQSWFFVISGAVWRREEFQLYWQGYLPLNSRQHAVWQGEIGISKTLENSGFKPFIAYPSADFLTALQRKNPPPAELKALFPKPATQNITNQNTLAHLGALQQKASPIHFWQIWGIKNSSLPFIKKDLFYRAVFDEAQIRSFIPDKNMQEEILSKTPPRHALQKFLWRQGMI